MIKYKIDVLAELKKAGYSTYRIRKEKLFGEREIQEIRQGKVICNINMLSKLCELLQCQPADIIEYQPEK